MKVAMAEKEEETNQEVEAPMSEDLNVVIK
jgi:hypothetical protein